MYVGVYATLLASVIYTMNPFVLALAVFIIVVHHRIVLAEEQFLRQAFEMNMCSILRACPATCSIRFWTSLPCRRVRRPPRCIQFDPRFVLSPEPKEV